MSMYVAMRWGRYGGGRYVLACWNFVKPFFFDLAEMFKGVRDGADGDSATTDM